MIDNIGRVYTVLNVQFQHYPASQKRSCLYVLDTVNSNLQNRRWAAFEITTYIKL